MNSILIRDLAIDAAIQRMAMIRDPNISSADIQRRGSTTVFSGGYIVLLDGKLLATVFVRFDNSFTIQLPDESQCSQSSVKQSGDK